MLSDYIYEGLGEQGKHVRFLTPVDHTHALPAKHTQAYSSTIVYSATILYMISTFIYQLVYHTYHTYTFPCVLNYVYTILIISFVL